MCGIRLVFRLDRTRLRGLATSQNLRDMFVGIMTAVGVVHVLDSPDPTNILTARAALRITTGAQATWSTTAITKRRRERNYGANERHIALIHSIVASAAEAQRTEYGKSKFLLSLFIAIPRQIRYSVTQFKTPFWDSIENAVVGEQKLLQLKIYKGRGSEKHVRESAESWKLQLDLPTGRTGQEESPRMNRKVHQGKSDDPNNILRINVLLGCLNIGGSNRGSSLIHV